MAQSADGTPNPNEGEDESTKNGTGNGAGTEGEEDQGDPRIKELSDEAARRRVEARDAKARAEAAEAKLKEIDDANKSEIDRATARAAELEAENAQAQAALKEARIQNAFLASNKYQWHNAERALALVDLSEVTIDEDGKVTGLDKALEALAKSDSYLIKGDDAGDGTPPGSTGAPAGTGKKKDPAVATREQLASKYPILR